MSKIISSEQFKRKSCLAYPKSTSHFMNLSIFPLVKATDYFSVKNIW